jgi:hypothetical protein
MQPRRVIFLRLPSGVFGNGGQSWLSIDLAPSKVLLENLGFLVTESTIDKTMSLDLRDDDIIIYSSCEALDIREYMKDVFYFLRDRCLLIPHYDLLLAYENKGFQELFRQAHGFGNLRGDYHYDLDSAPRSFPYVLKTTTGAGSIGVRLVRSDDDLVKTRRDLFSISIRRRVAMLQRKWKLSNEHYEAYRYRHKGFRRYVVQEFVPALEYDYRVTIFGDRFFAFKRRVRRNDFRASGSKDFDFSGPVSSRVLDFAASVAEKLNAPQLSLDIADSGHSCHLIEYQAMNFGRSAIERSQGYHLREGDGWAWIASGPSNLGETYAHSLEAFFSRHGVKATA